ncbi:hypothetical protein B5F76_08205 [Desulfovibrio sp. An276]|nr:hypothetical protein B5F76_08205 [Desulfovibrio sp. An276]
MPWNSVRQPGIILQQKKEITTYVTDWRENFPSCMDCSRLPINMRKLLDILMLILQVCYTKAYTYFYLQQQTKTDPLSRRHISRKGGLCSKPPIHWRISCK